MFAFVKCRSRLMMIFNSLATSFSKCGQIKATIREGGHRLCGRAWTFRFAREDYLSLHQIKTFREANHNIFGPGCPGDWNLFVSGEFRPLIKARLNDSSILKLSLLKLHQLLSEIQVSSRVWSRSAISAFLFRTQLSLEDDPLALQIRRLPSAS